MSSDGLVAAINDLCNLALGADWYDFRDRFDAWAHAHPAEARELVHFAHLLMEEWDE